MTKKKLLKEINEFRCGVQPDAVFQQAEFIHLLLDFMECILRRRK